MQDEENRIHEIEDNGHTDRYVYDASGTRIIKRGPQGTTVYVNPWFTVRNGSIVTKAVYAGAVRLATVLVPGDKISSFPGQGLVHRSSQADLHARNTEQNPNLQNRPYPGVFVYYYHPDHLESTAAVTDQNGRLYESLAYFPFGETWIDRGPDTQRIPYRYTAKELDQDTELYYYGARYYDPRTSVWESADPALGGYLGGGIYRPANLALFTYGYDNPVRLIDPNGRSPLDFIVGVGNAINNDVTLGAAPRLQGNADLQRGQAVGDVIAIIMGSAETTLGGGGEVGGTALDLTVVGAAAGVPVQAVSAVMIGQGIAINAHAATQLGMAMSRNGEEQRNGEKSTTLQPGPHAGESIPARDKGRSFNPEERQRVNEIGRTTGCHTCGTKVPGTKSGNFVPDHQPPSAIAPENESQRLYPQCLDCSRRQGGEIRGQQQVKPETSD